MKMKRTLLVILILALLSATALGADARDMCLNEIFRVQFESVNDANEIVETTLLAESWPEGTTTIDDPNNIVTFSPQTTGVFYLEVSLEPVSACWEPKKRLYSWEITVNPTQSWTVKAVESVESK